jgi:asparagine synthase (glutamine-hydrolysing)
MRSVIEHTGCNAHFIKADEFSPMIDMEKWFWHADHPIGTPNLYMSWSVCKAAESQGVKVLLTGTDGDATISHGYEDFFEFARRGRWLTMYNEAKALKANHPVGANGLRKSLWNRGFQQVWEEIKYKANHHTGRSQNFAKKRKYRNAILRRMPINDEFFHREDLERRFGELFDRHYSYDVNRIENHWNGLISGTYAFILETFEKCSAAFGVEERHPFFDRRLVEFCIALPPGQKLNKGWTRSILRRSLTGVIPPDVQWRKGKSNLGAHSRLGSISYERDRINETLYQHSHVLEAYLDVAALTDAVNKYVANPMGGRKYDMMMIIAVQLSAWLRQSRLTLPAK